MIHPGELLSAYLDGEVSGQERDTVTSHLRDCQACQDELSDLHWARSALRSLPTLELPPGLVEPDQIAPVVPIVRRPRVWAAAAAAVVAVFVGVATLFAPEPTVPITFTEIAVQHNNQTQLDPPLTPGKPATAVTIPIGGAE